MEPKLLTSLSGEPITTKELWEKYRREEILHLLEHYAYGERPVDKPDKFTFQTEIVNEDLCGMIYKKVTIDCDGFVFTVKGFIPKCEKPVPAFVYLMHEAQENKTNIDEEPNTLFIPIADLGAKGYATFVLYLSSIYPDQHHKANYEAGIYKVYAPNRAKRKDSDWASISAWSWAASRIVDYMETDNSIDKNHIGIVGHSRSGKTALWAGANDKRFSFVVSNSSGCMGAAMLRGKTGEHIADISITDWFCGNHPKYAEYEEMFPVDQHMLLALIAPRLLYVQSSSLDDWSDPASERRACRLAGEAYALYGEKGVVMPEEIRADVAYHEGRIGYHMSTGEHKIRANDWEMFVKYWEKHR